MAEKTIKQLSVDAKALLLEAKTIYDLKDDASVEQLTLAETKTAEAQVIVANLEKFGATRTNSALKTINTIENTISVFEKVDRPGLGGNGSGSPASEHGRAAASLKTAGDTFIESERYQDYLKSITSGGRIAERTLICSPPVEVKTLYTSAGDITQSRPMLGQADRRDDIVRIGWNRLTLRQLISNLTTANDQVEVIRELTHTSNADTVAEATATSGQVGVKPESSLNYEIIQANVQTIAHWIPATTRILSDSNRLKGEIDYFLGTGVDQKLEDQMLNGNGTSPNLPGIYGTSGILTQALVNGDFLTTTRRARTKLMVSGFTVPTAYLMTPNNWEDVDLLQDGEQRYYFGGPWVMGSPRLWGVPVSESVYATDNLPLLGNFVDAVIYDREQTQITVSNQHADFFIRNMIAILAEMRAAFHVRRPTSFIAITVPTHA